MSRVRLGHDRGSATVYAVILALAIAMIAVIAAQCIALAGIQHEAASAADLSAIAASKTAQAGGDGCERARAVAGRNDATVRTCVLTDEVATVTVQIKSPKMWGRTWTVAQKARAAPGDYTFESDG